MQPIGDKVIVICQDELRERRSPGGLIIPETADERYTSPKLGTVYAVGKEVKEISAGHNVIVSAGSGSEMTVQDDELFPEPVKGLICHESDIMAILEQDEPEKEQDD